MGWLRLGRRDIHIKIDPVRDVSGLWQIWFSPSAIEEEGHYWPLVYTTFWLEHKLWGFDPAGYHIVNVLLHLANTLLLWHLLRRLTVSGAWVVVAVFAVHPLHVESVAWVIERKDVLSGLFYLAAVLAWMRFVEQPRPQVYVWPLTLYAAGLLSKSIVITLPAALLIWHWWKQGRVTSIDLLRLVPFCVVGLVITVGDLSFFHSVGSPSFGYSLTERALIAARALWFYAGKLLWPTNLSVIYPLWDIRVADPLAWGYLIAAVALVVDPLALPAAGWARTAGWDVVFCGHAIAGAGFRRLRLYEVCVCRRPLSVSRWHWGYGRRHRRRLLMACIACRLVAKGRAGRCGVVLVVLGMLTWRQASIYRDNETFNRHIIALNPQARNIHRHLGNALRSSPFNQARYAEALDAYRVAAVQRPNYLKYIPTSARFSTLAGTVRGTETHLRRAIALIQSLSTATAI